MYYPHWQMTMFAPFSFFIYMIYFVVISIVLIIVLKILKKENIKEIYKNSILRIWIFSFISNMTAASPFFLLNMINDYSSEEMVNLLDTLSAAPFTNLYTGLMTVAVFVLGVGMSYFLMTFVLKETDLTKKERVIVVCALVFFTAPYFIMFP